MSALGLSLIAFVCIFGATLLGAYLRTVLPMHHLSTETKETVRLSMGVIGTMAALVLGLLIGSAKTRLLLYAQAENTIPLPFLVLLIFWLAIIFGSFSLFVAPNPVLIASFLVCAISASGALFLIFELVTPFSGLMPISDAPLRHALAPL